MTTSMLKIEMELPRDLFVAMNVSEAEIERKAREWLALELYREGHISGGKAAEIIGVSKAAFIDMLNQHGVPYLDLPPGELDHEHGTALSATKDKS